MYISKLPLDTSRAFEVINLDDFKREAFEKFKTEMPDATKRKLNYHVKKKVDKLFKEGYKEFIFSEKPEPGEGVKVIVSFEEANGKIYQKWEIVIDTEYYHKQIQEKKAALANSDYKIIKNYEAEMSGEVVPYNIDQLREERQSLRDTINELKKNITIKSY